LRLKNRPGPKEGAHKNNVTFWALLSRLSQFCQLKDTIDALTTVKIPENLDRKVCEVAATWLALGLDPERVTFYRQSDIPEVFELTWILSCYAAKGLLNKAHAYKTALEANLEIDRDPDADINTGLYNYPVLMAAGRLLLGTRKRIGIRR